MRTKPLGSPAERTSLELGGAKSHLVLLADVGVIVPTKGTGYAHVVKRMIRDIEQRTSIYTTPVRACLTVLTHSGGLPAGRL